VAKRILIPVDFNVESLITLKKAIDELGDFEIEAILLYSEHLTDSISELLLYSPKEKKSTLIPDLFHEALAILKNKYEKNLISVSVEFFHGYGTNAFKNLVKGNRIDIIYIPSDYKLKLDKNGFDPLPIIRKSQIPFQEVSWIREQNFANTESLSNLFM
jgi:hypothetical protein